MTLDELVRQRLAEATEQSKETQIDESNKNIVFFNAKLKKHYHSDNGGIDWKSVSKETKDELVKNGAKDSGIREHIEITEADLEAMTEDEVKAIDEEQLDELSKATLGSYINKAHFNGGLTDFKHGKATANLEPAKDREKLAKKSEKRDDGIEKAVKKLTKEDTVSSQVASLLEAEGLSDEFKVQAVTIFEAAVTDRVLQIEEGLKEEFEANLVEAKKALNNDIDGFVSEAIQQWKQDNAVAINSNFKSQLAESFMDGLQALISEHNIEVPEGKEDALKVAMGEVDKLNEANEAKDTEMLNLLDQVNSMKAEKLLESFKEKMTVTEFDRFVQLTESIKFKDETQYEKQLSIVLENFGNKPTEKKAEVIVEEVTIPAEVLVVESNSRVAQYAKHLSKQ